MIEFEVKQQKCEIGVNKGKIMYYAAPKVNKRVTVRQMEDYIVNATSLARGDVRNALTSLSEFVNTSLANGDAVELADLGMIKVTISSKQMAKPEEVTSATLKQPQIKFFPKQEMRDAANRVKVKVVNQHTGTVSERE